MNTISRKKVLSGLIASAFGIAAAGVPAAFAATDTPTAPPARTAATAAQPQVQADRFERASKLIGMKVRSPSDENLGDIKDLVIDTRNGTVRYAVLSFGGMLGLGDKLFAYPMNAFKPTDGNDRLVLNVDKAKLKDAPGFASNQWPDLNQQNGYASKVDRFFGMHHAAAPGSPLHRASDLIGKEVNDRNGKDVGHVNDIVVNVRNAKIDYAVVEVDRIKDFPDKLIQVPLQSLAFDTNNAKRMVLNVDQAQLDRTAGFDRNKWPDLNDKTYRTSVDRALHAPMWAATATANRTAAAAAPSSASRFEQLDANHDNRLTADEARADSSLTAQFKSLDRNGDGVITRDEFTSSRASPK